MTTGLPYRPSAGIMLINRDNLVWIGSRTNLKLSGSDESMYRWQMPQGGITHNEAPAKAALRELEEETGVRSARIIAESSDWLTYDLPLSALSSLGGKYRGQRMKWFAIRFLGEDDEVDIGGDHGGGPEFDAWRWAPIDELVDLIVPFKRPVYEAVVAQFRPLILSA
jgi:putative (di)nucleoside polyphosphate hydrolase